jgi:nitroreductase
MTTSTLANETLALQLGRRSTRLFLPDPVRDDQLEAIVAAAQAAPTSSNLQAWSVVVVRDPARKQRLAELAGEQRWVAEAPVVLVWLADLGRARRLAARAGRPLEGADYLETTLLGVIDTALAAQNAIVAAESLGLGSTCVGAMRNHPEEVARELGLPAHTFAVFGLAVGRPDPAEAAGVKPRLPRSAVLHLEQYDAAAADAGVTEYDGLLASYDGRYGRSGTWSERVLNRLASRTSLVGRDRMRSSLERLGWPSR